MQKIKLKVNWKVQTFQLQPMIRWTHHRVALIATDASAEATLCVIASLYWFLIVAFIASIAFSVEAQ